jgi:transposase-like protein
MRGAQVIPGPGGRRRWSDEQKRALLEAFAPDASVGAVAPRVDVVPAQMCRWRHVGAVPGCTAVGGTGN